MKLQIKSKVMSVHEKMDVLNEDGGLAYHVHSKVLSIHDKTRIDDAAGNEVAYIHAKAVSIHHVYYVDMMNGESFELREELTHIKDVLDIEPLGWQLRGKNILAYHFQIVDADERVIATSHREVISLHDTYYLDIFDDAQADKVVAIFVIMRHLIANRNAGTDVAWSPASGDSQ